MLQSFMPPNLKKVDELILFILFHALEPQSAREIRKRLRTEIPNGKDVLYGSIYTSLARLEQQGLIDSIMFVKNSQDDVQGKSAFQCTQNGKNLIENQTVALGYK